MGVADIVENSQLIIMPVALVEQNWFRWAISLILGFP